MAISNVFLVLVVVVVVLFIARLAMKIRAAEKRLEEQVVRDLARTATADAVAAYAAAMDYGLSRLRRSDAEETLQFVLGVVAPADRVTAEDIADILGISIEEAGSLLRQGEEEALCFQTTEGLGAAAHQVWEITI